MLDMGCHSIEYTRWVLGKPKVKSVTAFMGTYIHKDRTQGEDHSYTIVEYEGDKIAIDGVFHLKSLMLKSSIGDVD